MKLIPMMRLFYNESWVQIEKDVNRFIAEARRHGDILDVKFYPCNPNCEHMAMVYYTEESDC